MRITQLVRVLAVSGLASTAIDAQAQSTIAPTVNQVTTEQNFSNHTTAQIDLSDPKLIKARSMTRVVVNQLGVSPVATEKLMEHIDAQSLVDGGVELSLKKVDAQSLLEEHTVNVKVNYDPRPIGGILTVRVSMMPSFRGVGISTRPATSRSIALAVDELTEETVKGLVDELTAEIKTEFDTMQPGNPSGTN